MPNTKTYKVAVVWQMWGIMDVEATSLEEARRLAIDNHSLPSDAAYVEDSCVIDEEFSIEEE